MKKIEIMAVQKMKLVRTILLTTFITLLFSVAAYGQNFYSFTISITTKSGLQVTKTVTLDATDPLVEALMNPMNQQVQQNIAKLGLAATQDQIDAMGYFTMAKYMNGVAQSNPEALDALNVALRQQIIASDGSLTTTIGLDLSQCAEYAAIGYAGAAQNGLTLPQLISTNMGADGVPHFALVSVNSVGDATVYNMGSGPSAAIQNWSDFAAGITTPPADSTTPAVIIGDVNTFADELDFIANSTTLGGYNIVNGTPAQNAIFQAIAMNAGNGAAPIMSTAGTAAYDAGNTLLVLKDVYGNPLTPTALENVLTAIGNAIANNPLVQKGTDLVDWIAEQFPGISGVLEDNPALAEALGTGGIYLQATGLALDNAQLFAWSLGQSYQSQISYAGAFQLACNQSGASCGSATQISQLGQGITSYYTSSVTDDGNCSGTPNLLYNPDVPSSGPASFCAFSTLSPPGYSFQCVSNATGCAAGPLGSLVSTVPNGYGTANDSVQIFPNGNVVNYNYTGMTTPGGVAADGTNTANVPVYAVFQNGNFLGVTSSATGLIPVGSDSLDPQTWVNAIVGMGAGANIPLDEPTVNSLIAEQPLAVLPDSAYPTDTVANEEQALVGSTTDPSTNAALQALATQTGAATAGDCINPTGSNGCMIGNPSIASDITQGVLSVRASQNPAFNNACVSMWGAAFCNCVNNPNITNVESCYGGGSSSSASASDSGTATSDSGSSTSDSSSSSDSGTGSTDDGSTNSGSCNPLTDPSCDPGSSSSDSSGNCNPLTDPTCTPGGGGGGSTDGNDGPYDDEIKVK